MSIKINSISVRQVVEHYLYPLSFHLFVKKWSKKSQDTFFKFTVFLTLFQAHFMYSSNSDLLRDRIYKYDVKKLTPIRFLLVIPLFDPTIFMITCFYHYVLLPVYPIVYYSEEKN